MRFVATEAGFEDGLGGASNTRDSGASHYVLFGIQKDEQQPANSGIYFEWDDQENGMINCVSTVSVTSERAVFTLTTGKKIVVERGVSAPEWARLEAGIAQIFASQLAMTPRG